MTSMDTELARTFLVVIATGSFVAASQRLHVTQSTVSTRFQRLAYLCFPVKVDSGPLSLALDTIRRVSGGGVSVPSGTVCLIGTSAFTV